MLEIQQVLRVAPAEEVEASSQSVLVVKQAEPAARQRGCLLWIQLWQGCIDGIRPWMRERVGTLEP